MHMDYMLLADAVSLADGKLYIHGAGWDTIAASSLPVNQSLNIALRIRVPWNETNQQRVLELDVVDADGNSLFPVSPGPTRGTINVGRPSHLRSGEDQVVPLALHLGELTFQQEGAYAVVFRMDGSELARASFSVVALKNIAR